MKLSIAALSAIMLSLGKQSVVSLIYCYAECRYAECHNSEGIVMLNVVGTIFSTFSA